MRPPLPARRRRRGAACGCRPRRPAATRFGKIASDRIGWRPPAPQEIRAPGRLPGLICSVLAVPGSRTRPAQGVGRQNEPGSWPGPPIRRRGPGAPGSASAYPGAFGRQAQSAGFLGGEGRCALVTRLGAHNPSRPRQPRRDLSEAPRKSRPGCALRETIIFRPWQARLVLARNGPGGRLNRDSFAVIRESLALMF